MRWAWVAMVACAAYRSDGSGVDGDKRLTALGDAEIEALCKYIVEVYGPPRTIDCGDYSLTIGGRELSSCIADTKNFIAAFPRCEATVDDRESCDEEVAAFEDSEVCNDVEQPRSCNVFTSLECGGR